MELKRLVKCTECGAVAEELIPCNCPCELECCGKKMAPVEAKTADSTTEKHVPVAEKLSTGGTRVIVGSTPHPMTDAHYIVWIEIINGPYVNRYYLKPNMPAEACFHVELKPGMIVREYCNIHGLWETIVK